MTEITIAIPDEAMESIDQWLDSDFNIDRIPDNKGQILNHRRVKDAKDAIKNHVQQFIQARLAEFPPSSDAELIAAQEALIAAQAKHKEAKARIVDSVTVHMDAAVKPDTPQPVKA